VQNSGAKRADWQQANPPAIARSLKRAQSKPDGGWYVVDATRRITNSAKPRTYMVNDVELVAWNESAHTIQIAPGACPHMGAHLGGATVTNGCLVCPWHGLELGGEETGAQQRHNWAPFRTYDDGVLTWVQLDPSDPNATEQPFIPKRPDLFLDGVIRRDVKCEPSDIIANRLDPWHGAHFHPYAFTRLEVTDHNNDELHLRVAYKVMRGYEIEVSARFDCPDPRTIVMTITDGEGTGSVVETHATPVRSASATAAPLTTVIEATLATSDRAGFVHAQRGAALARPIIKALAARLWRDDARYAERLYTLRSTKRA
jgi:phenylpropionate dioxygenase-like ring-hydroxylating dioxygenase large terminal subunit